MECSTQVGEFGWWEYLGNLEGAWKWNGRKEIGLHCTWVVERGYAGIVSYLLHISESFFGCQSSTVRESWTSSDDVRNMCCLSRIDFYQSRTESGLQLFGSKNSGWVACDDSCISLHVIPDSSAMHARTGWIRDWDVLFWSTHAEARSSICGQVLIVDVLVRRYCICSFHIKRLLKSLVSHCRKANYHQGPYHNTLNADVRSLI